MLNECFNKYDIVCFKYKLIKCQGGKLNSIKKGSRSG